MKAGCCFVSASASFTVWMDGGRELRGGVSGGGRLNY